MAKTHPGCKDCREITLAQTRCINCNGKTERVVTLLIPERPGEVFSGWRCKRCHLLWDGGAAYDYACIAHGGKPAVTPPDTKDIEPGTPIGDYAGRD